MRKTLILTIATAFLAFSPFLTARAQETSAVDKTFGVICCSVAQFRVEGKMSGESATQALMGMPVTIMEKNDNGWYHATNMEGYEGWTLTRNIAPMTKEEYADYQAKPKVICMVKHSSIFSKPSTESMQICDVVLGDIMIDAGELSLEKLNASVTAENNYNMREFIDPAALSTIYKKSAVKKLSKEWMAVAIADGREGYIPKGDVKDLNDWLSTAYPTEENIVATAKLFMGLPYTWGGTSYKGVDCSGLAKSSYFLNGYVLLRDASQQFYTGDYVDIQKFVEGERTLENLKNLRPGDLLFFGRKATAEKKERATHVGIYLGDGLMIHSSTVVRINTLIPGHPNSYGSTILGARRIIGTADQNKGVVSVKNIINNRK